MNNRAVTLVEIVVVVLLVGIVFAATTAVIMFEMKLSNRLVAQDQMEQERYYILSHLKKQIHNSAYADISSGPTSISLYDKDDTLLGTYTYQDTTLSYNNQPLSDMITAFMVDDSITPGNTAEIRLLKIDLTIKNTQKPILKPINISISAIPSERSYHATSGGVVWNVDRDRYYDNIQETVDDADQGNEIRVMGKDIVGEFEGIFQELVTITKPVILKGSYDSTFQTQDTINTPTIIDGESTRRCLYLTLNQPGNITIDGFTIKNGYVQYPNGGGIYARVDDGSVTLSNNTIEDNTTSWGRGGGIQAIVDGGSIDFSNNTIKDNTAKNSAGGIWTSVDNGGSITLSGNTITQNSGGRFTGGGVLVSALGGSSVILSDNIIEGNSAGGVGGGIYATAQDGSSIALSNNTIEDNGSGAFGAGIYTTAYSSSITISNNNITENRCIGTTSAAGIYAQTYNGGSITISNNTITENTVNFGSGGGITAYAYDGSITISNNIVEDNSTRGGAGGGLYTRTGSNGNITLSNNTIEGNTSNGGGGIQARTDGGPMTISNNTIAENTSTFYGGGGILVRGYDGGSMIISNNIIEDNTYSPPLPAWAGGGGLYAHAQSGSSITISNNTIEDNTANAGSGYGIYAKTDAGSSITISNSIVYNNQGDGSHNNYYIDGDVSVLHSDIEDYPIGGNNIDEDPLFIDSTNDNYTLTYSNDGNPANDSPCVDTGDPAIQHNDPEDPGNPGFAKDPAKGTIINDMGTYGGPGAASPIGAYTTADDITTPYINENAIGTY